MTARLGVVLVLVVTLGCALLELASPTREPVPATLPDPGATPSPVSPAPTSTPEPSATPDACPAVQDLQPPVLTDALEDNIAAVETYLDRGGRPERIEPEELATLLQGDLTGDGALETVVALVDPLSDQVPPKGYLVVFTCRDGGVVQLYRYEPADWYGLELIAIADMTGDGIADVIFSDVSCGAHTCWHTPYVWSWAGGDFVDHMGGALQFPYPDFSVRDGDLIVVSGGIGSVGAGPQRPVTTTLSWTGQEVAIVDERTAPPTYRYHAFVDGDLALSAGDLDQAGVLYRRVVEDETLTAWGAASSPEVEHDGLRALGQWRLVITGLLQGDRAAAESRHTALMSSPQDSAVRGAVKVLAERFWRSYQRDADLLGACAYAVNAESAQTLIDFLYGFGYANPAFDQEDLCPHLRS